MYAAFHGLQTLYTFDLEFNLLSHVFNGLSIAQIKKLKYLPVHKQSVEKDTLFGSSFLNIGSGKGEGKTYLMYTFDSDSLGNLKMC